MKHDSLIDCKRLSLTELFINKLSHFCTNICRLFTKFLLLGWTNNLKLTLKLLNIRNRCFSRIFVIKINKYLKVTRRINSEKMSIAEMKAFDVNKFLRSTFNNEKLSGRIYLQLVFSRACWNGKTEMQKTLNSKVANAARG